MLRDNTFQRKGAYAMPVPLGSQPSPGPLARAVSAQVRTLMAEHSITAQDLAKKAGLSRSYLGKRLRYESSFTVNDIEAICTALNEPLELFSTEVIRRRRREKAQEDAKRPHRQS